MTNYWTNKCKCKTIKGKRCRNNKEYKYSMCRIHMNCKKTKEMYVYQISLLMKNKSYDKNIFHNILSYTCDYPNFIIFINHNKICKPINLYPNQIFYNVVEKIKYKYNIKMDHIWNYLIKLNLIPNKDGIIYITRIKDVLNNYSLINFDSDEFSDILKSPIKSYNQSRYI